MGGKNRSRKPASGHEWNLKEIQELVDMLAHREITEFEMERDGLRIRFRRDRAAANAPPFGDTSDRGGRPDSTGTSQALPVSMPAAAPAALAPATGADPAGAVADDVFVIKSPIVGTFYGAPTPNAPPFVKMHDSVQVGQVLCIVEAMKLMNEIESEVAGEIVRVYIESGQPVEYGQPLFAIQPSHK